MTLFDRLASTVASFVSRAPFFTACVLLVLLWLPSYFIFTSLDTWQLIINTITTIVTFLLVALLQNTQTRADAASQQKLNAIADALADLLQNDPAMRAHARDLREAVGLEERTSA